jgi:DnaA-like protein
MRDLIARAAQIFGLKVADLTGRSREHHIVEARQAAAYALRTRYAKLSLQAIGNLLGDRDHTTIIWAIKVVEQRLDDDPTSTYAGQVRELLDTPPTTPEPAPIERPTVRATIARRRAAGGPLIRLRGYRWALTA